ncbi:MAG: hypothetical protein JW820_18445 [Spirochaetales bacterium]|nr:hypothetical protein [Spirochaetales bacterium]
MSESIFTRKRKTRAWIAVPLALLPLYLFLFPRPTGLEVLLRPVWALELEREVGADGAAAPVGAAGEESAVLPFRAGERFGYATVDGRLLYSGVSRHGVALSQRGFINYGSRPDHMVFMDPGGGFQFSVHSFGYPMLDSSGQVLYSVNTDLGGLKRLSTDGELLWQGEFSSPLTSVALQGERCLVGLLDGRAALFGPAGEVLFEIDPPGSRIPVILATALADTGDLALVSGVDPQNLILVQGERFETIRSEKLDSDFRREIVLSFGPEGRFLYAEQEDAIMVLELGRERSARLPLPGRLESLAAGKDFAAVTAAAAAGAAAAGDGAAPSDDTGARATTLRLAVFRPLASPLAVASVPGATVWSRVSEQSLFLGLDDALLRADVVEQ